jgi:PAS domain S-box-containing protein
MHWVGPDGKIIWANRCELAMLGYAPEEYIGRHIAEFHADKKVIHDILSRLGSRETLINYEARLKCKDGSFRDVLINSNVRWDGDKFVHTRCFTRDISDRRNYEKHIELLGREAEHRAKNVLATVQAIVHLTQAASPADVKMAIAGRIRALANVHTLFTDSHWKGADLRSLVTGELAPYSQDGDARITLQGPDCVLDPPRAQTIAMAMHELATNAAKYGALSESDGRIDVEWQTAPDGALRLKWKETGGPPVQTPERKGFGTAVLENMIKGQSKGEMIMDWRPEGLACDIRLPASS